MVRRVFFGRVPANSPKKHDRARRTMQYREFRKIPIRLTNEFDTLGALYRLSRVHLGDKAASVWKQYPKIAKASIMQSCSARPPYRVPAEQNNLSLGESTHRSCGGAFAHLTFARSKPRSTLASSSIKWESAVAPAQSERPRLTSARYDK